MNLSQALRATRNDGKQTMVLIYGLGWVGLGYVGGWIAARKGYSPRLGVALAILFGPVALAVCAFLPMTEEGREQAELERQIDQDGIYQNKLKNCPRCNREVAFTCRICPQCEHRFVPARVN